MLIDRLDSLLERMQLRLGLSLSRLLLNPRVRLYRLCSRPSYRFLLCVLCILHDPFLYIGHSALVVFAMQCLFTTRLCASPLTATRYISGVIPGSLPDSTDISPSERLQAFYEPRHALSVW